MNVEYIIVQAGGKGTRMSYLTWNKPKCLVPVNNLPMIFHLFKKYPDKKFIIIGDYLYDVLEKYLAVFAEIKYIMIDARGAQGTCAGIRGALNKIPNKKSFMIIWSDLILSEAFDFPDKENNYVGLSGDFPCRWKFENNIFQEEASIKKGVAGLFLFKEKELLRNIPYEGEFVKWIQDYKIEFEILLLERTKEYGLIEKYNKLNKIRCRPFNQIIDKKDRIEKRGIDKQGIELAAREKKWYQTVKEMNYDNIPAIYNFEPFIMEKIEGKHIYEYGSADFDIKYKILENVVQALRKLHKLNECEPDYFSIKETYLSKTFARIDKVRSLIPFVNQEYILINNRKCKNIYFYYEQLEKYLSNYKVETFHLIHGDSTFSNVLIKEDLQPVFIDPRGYFGYTQIYGDSLYDWAKVYYSIVGNYDQFNLKEFRLIIKQDAVELSINSNGWENMEEKFWELLSNRIDKLNIKLLHALIWLSLTTYAWEDYDSICGAFYNGLYYLEEVRRKLAEDDSEKVF